MLAYLFVKKKILLNFTEFFEMSIFFLQTKQLSKFVKTKLPIYPIKLFYFMFYEMTHESNFVEHVK